MEKDFITIGGVQYRVEVNWNAMTGFLALVGKDTVNDLSTIGDIRPSEITALMAAAIKEGERLEGRSFTQTPEDIGAVIKPSDVSAFMDIYIRQSAPAVPAESAKKKETEV